MPFMANLSDDSLFINRFLSFFVDSGNLAPSESKAKAMKGIRIRQTSDSDGQW